MPAHEYDNDLSGACRFANYPAKRGLRVFAADVRCLGRSDCPQRDATGRVVDGLLAAVAQLRQRGVTRVALVSASMGGSAALIAATRAKRPVDPVVELSGQAKPTSLVRIPLNGGAVQVPAPMCTRGPRPTTTPSSTYTEPPSAMHYHHSAYPIGCPRPTRSGSDADPSDQARRAWRHSQAAPGDAALAEHKQGYGV